MYIENLVKLINYKLADSLISQTVLLNHMDSVIDDINAMLSTVFPTFTEAIVEEGTNNPDYNHIPDKYLRSVVVVGAANKYYEVDEEGNQTAVMFAQEYRQNLFYMLRDYSISIPERYRDNFQGMVELSDESVGAPRMNIRGNWPFDSGWGWH